MSSKTITGLFGRGELCQNDLPPSDARSAAVRTWLLDCPNQSPAWRHYMVFAIHLRAIAGTPPAEITEPGATHQITVLALDPMHHPSITDPESRRYLMPANYEQQVKLDTDAQASDLCDMLARAFVNGVFRVEPLPVIDRPAIHNAIRNTAEHMRRGYCPLDPDSGRIN